MSDFDTEVVQHDPTAEQIIIGVALHRPDQIDTATLTPEDFYVPAHSHLWWLLQTLRAAGEPITIQHVHASLGRLATAGKGGVGPALLHQCQAEAIAFTDLAFHASLVRQYATRRSIAVAGLRIRQLANWDGDPAEAVEIARQEIDAIDTGVRADADLIGDDYEDFLIGLEAESTLTPTPWPKLTEILGGWSPGALYVIAARPSIGKTIAGLQAAIDLARTGHVAVTSMEMTRTELQQRATAHLAQVPLGRLKGKSPLSTPLNEFDWQRIAKARGEIISLKLAINDRTGSTVTAIRAHARGTARRGPLAAVVIDYLGLLSPSSGDRRPRHEQVAEWSRQLKNLAQELQVPVILLAQLNRDSTKRADGRPQLSDLRDSGAVEQDADVVMLLHAEDPADTAVDLIVAKNRQGVLGTVPLWKRGATAEFVQRGDDPVDPPTGERW